MSDTFRYEGVALIVLTVAIIVFVAAASHDSPDAIVRASPIDLNAHASLLSRVPARSIQRSDFAIDSVSSNYGRLMVGSIQAPLIIASPFTPIVITGWTIDDRTHAPPSTLLAVVDNGPGFAAQVGIERPDVAQALQNDRARYAGFSAILPGRAFGPGTHTVALRLIDATRREGAAISTTIRVQCR